MIFPNFTNQIAETVRVMFHDSRGIFWFGTHGGAFKLVNGKLIHIDGLISNDVWSIETDSKGNIWIGIVDRVSVYNGREFAAYELPEGKIDTTLGV